MKFMHCIKMAGLSAGLVVLTGAAALAQSYDFDANGATPAGAPTDNAQITPGTVYDEPYTYGGITFTGGAVVNYGVFDDVVGPLAFPAPLKYQNEYFTDNSTSGLPISDGTYLSGTITGTLANPTDDLDVYVASANGLANLKQTSVATVDAYNTFGDLLESDQITLAGRYNNESFNEKEPGLPLTGTASFVGTDAISYFTVTDNGTGGAIALYSPTLLPVPEASTFVGLGAGIALMAGLAFAGRRKANSAV